MDPTLISSIAGAILSLLFSYVPGLRDKFEQLSPDHKRLAMLGLLLLVVLGALGLSCINKSTAFTCDEAGLWQALEAFLAAAIANQTAYALSPGVHKEYVETELAEFHETE